MEDKLCINIKRKYVACREEARRLQSVWGKNTDEHEDAIKAAEKHAIISYWKGRAESYQDIIETDAIEKKLSRKRFTASNISNSEINKSLEDIQDRIDALCEDIRNEIDDLVRESAAIFDDLDRYTVVETRLSALRYLLSCLDEDFTSFRLDCEEA